MSTCFVATALDIILAQDEIMVSCWRESYFVLAMISASASIADWRSRSNCSLLVLVLVLDANNMHRRVKSFSTSVVTYEALDKRLNFSIKDVVSGGLMEPLGDGFGFAMVLLHANQNKMILDENPR